MVVERNTAPDAWRKWALAGWVLAVLVVCLHTLWKPGANSTYPIFANAGRNWLEGRNLYGGLAENLDVFRYSPLTAAAFAPLSLAPNGPAGALWRLLNVAVFLTALLWWARAVLPAPLDDVGRSRFLLLLLPLSVPCMYNGQSNLLVVGLMLAAVDGAAEGRWNLSSLFVALACMLKLYPLAIGLMLCALYPRQLILSKRWPCSRVLPCRFSCKTPRMSARNTISGRIP